MNKRKIVTSILVIIILLLFFLMFKIIQYNRDTVSIYKYADELYKVIKAKIDEKKIKDVSEINADNIEEILGVKLEDVKSITITYNDEKEIVIAIEGTDKFDNEVVQVDKEEVKKVESEDVIAPVITLNGYKKISLSLGEEYKEEGISVSDNKDGNITDRVVITNNINPNVVGKYTITYTTYDASGNKSVAYREVEIKDTIAPVITLNGNQNISLNKSSTYSDNGATARDNYDGDITNKIVTTNNVNINVVGTYYVKYNVSDSSGNKANEVTRTISVIEQPITPTKSTPVISIIGDKVINLEYGQTYTDLGATATDSIDGNITNKIVTTSNVDTSKVGTYYIKYNVTNTLGTKAQEIVRTIIVADKKKPAITLNGSSTVQVSVGSAYVDAGAKATDEYDGDITSNIIVTSNVNTNVVGTYYVKYNLSDSSKNIALEVIRTVHVVDNVKPVITIFGDSTIEIEGGSTYVEPGATATDNYDGDITSNIIVTNNINTNTLGTYYVKYNVTDNAGNSATEVIRTIHVIDTTEPAISSINGEEIEIEVFGEYIEPGATAIDNIDGDISNRIVITGTVDTNVIGTYYVRYNVVDNSGNNATEVVRTVHVVDKTKPVITIIGDAVINIEVMSEYTDLGSTALDNYDGDITSNIIKTNNVDTAIPGTYLVTYNVSDSSGNLAEEVIRTINVIDTTIPVITLNGDSEITIEAGSTYVDAGATALDNGSVNVTNSIVASGTVNTSSLGTYYITYNVEDAYGNNAIEVVRTINVVDTTVPAITLNGDNSIDLYVNDVYTELGATALDNKDGTVTVTISGTVDTSTVGAYTLTYTATDSSNNTATKTRIINVLERVVDCSGTWYSESKGVNAPQLVTGMTPIKWGGSSWVDTVSSDTNWYNYTTTNKEWANARTADGSMWVWIPRYAYQIETNYNTASVGTINIKFLKNKCDEASDSSIAALTPAYSGNSQTNYVSHPAFKLGTENLTGIWVAKFEASAAEGSSSTIYGCDSLDDVSTKTIKIVQNVKSWRCISIGNAFLTALNMKNKNAVYGWNSTEVDTHMMKNIEWGAIAYLSRSSYGKVNAVWSNVTVTTGCAGADSTASSDTTPGACNYAYNTLNGQQASTTGNVHGIYDMVGGGAEFTSAYINGTYASAISDVVNANIKYRDVYTVGNPDNAANNYNANLSKFGDAVHETSSRGDGTSYSWNQDLSNMPYGDSRYWFTRGGSFNTASPYYGIFAFEYYNTIPAVKAAFRPVVTIN